MFAANAETAGGLCRTDKAAQPSKQRIQMFDCTAFVSLLLARKSPQAASALAAFVAPLRSTCHLRRVLSRCGHLCQARRRAARASICSCRVGNLPCAGLRRGGAASVPRRLRSENHCKPCLGTPQTPPREQLLHPAFGRVQATTRGLAQTFWQGKDLQNPPRKLRPRSIRTSTGCEQKCAITESPATRSTPHIAYGKRSPGKPELR